MPPGLKREDEIDKRADEMFAAHPDLQNAEKSVGDAQIKAGTDQAEFYANNPDNATKKSEENPLNYQNDNTSNQKRSLSFKGKGNLKKKGPLGLIIGLLVGGFGGFSLLFTPGLALVHMKEMLSEDLNDQVAAMDIRSTHVFRAKLNDLGRTGSVCTSGIKVRCGFKGMSDRQIERFRAAGIEVETDGNRANTFGKRKVNSLSLTNSAGETITVSDPRQLNSMLNDRIMRQSLRKAFNAKFIGTADSVARKVFSKFGTSKANKLPGATDEERARNINDSVAGRGAEVDNPERLAGSEGETEEQRSQRTNTQGLADEQANRVRQGGGGASSVFGSAASGAAKGLLITGVADSACTVYNTSRAVAASAKVIRAAQLAGYAMVFLNIADRIKDGSATPEQVEYAGNILTETDSREQIVNENSRFDENEVAIPVENPDYQKSGFDSEGMRAAYYNDAPTLSARAQEFMVGGALVGTLSSVNTAINNAIGANNNCSFIQNPFVRAGSFVIGIAAGAVSFGASTVALVGASVAVSMVLPLLEAYLADMAAGQVVSSDTKGVDAGNAIFSGSAVLMSNMAGARGMKPLNSTEIQEYLALSDNVNKEYIALEVENAKSDPLDAYNRYSFLGSISHSLLPGVYSSSFSTGGNVLKNISSILIQPLSLTKSYAAGGDFNPERFTKCSDEGYRDIGIDADIFCNVRYGLTTAELAMDTDDVIEYMHPDHVDDEGEPKSDDYKKFITECTDRETGLGEPIEAEGDQGTGDICTSNEEKYSYFRVFTMDKTIYEAMDDSLTTESATNGSAGNPQVGSNVGSDDYATECRSYLSSGDCSGECVGFVKFRLVKHGVISARPLGNGKNVVATLGGLGYTVDRNPAVNSVFSRQSGGGGYGHTGMVSQVNPDGSIVVEEYNQDVSHGYGTRTIPKSEWDTSDYSFAHTEVDYQ